VGVLVQRKYSLSVLLLDMLSSESLNQAHVVFRERTRLARDFEFTYLAVRTEKKCWVSLSGQVVDAIDHSCHFSDEVLKGYYGACEIFPVYYLPVRWNDAGCLSD
jgi:hypothetical protein